MVSAVEKKLRLKSDMTLKPAGGAVLKAIPTTQRYVLTISASRMSG
jgi:polygalacturonase